jgi:hypothetical protein
VSLHEILKRKKISEEKSLTAGGRVKRNKI